MTPRLLLVLAMLLCGTPAALAQPCCGPITPAGQALAAFLDHTGVEHLWRSGWHADWRTGRVDRPVPGGREAKTHCSAFAAAIAARLGVYILRPPQHPQELLANAQMRWLVDRGAAAGWRPIENPVLAQSLANRGYLVVAAYINPNPYRPGHIAILRPSEKSRAALDRDGPDETQAGERNYLSVPLRQGFRHHPGAWPPDGPDAVRFFVHKVMRWPAKTLSGNIERHPERRI
jgi:hypothetical protein